MTLLNVYCSLQNWYHNNMVSVQPDSLNVCMSAKVYMWSICQSCGRVHMCGNGNVQMHGMHDCVHHKLWSTERSTERDPQRQVITPLVHFAHVYIGRQYTICGLTDNIMAVGNTCKLVWPRVCMASSYTVLCTAYNTCSRLTLQCPWKVIASLQKNSMKVLSSNLRNRSPAKHKRSLYCSCIYQHSEVFS